MRRGLGLVIQGIGAILLVVGLLTAVQLAGHTPWWQVLAFGLLVVAVGVGVFVAGGRVRRR